MCTIRINYTKHFALMLTTICLCACKNTSLDKESLQIIKIDFDKIEQIDITQGERIDLETIDASLLYSIDRLVTTADRLFIQSRKKIIAFDHSGNYLFPVGAVGRGPQEYITVNSFFSSRDYLSIFDWQSHKILNYDFDGQYVSSQNVMPSKPDNLFPSNIFPLSSGGYIAQNTYQGSPNSTPEFSLLNDQFEMVHPFQGLLMENGATRTDLLISKTNTLLYNQFFSDTLYRISPEQRTIEKAYYVDFGAHRLTEAAKKGKTYVDIIQESNTPEFIDNIATLVRYCHETQDKVSFIFVFRTNVHYVEYDKNTQTAKTFQLTNPNNEFKPAMFIAYKENEIYCAASRVNDLTSNPVLFKINARSFD